MESVSVLVPVHNGARFLRRAVASALGQGPHLAEIVVSDDASTDASGALLAEFGSSVRLVRQERRLGLTANHNALLRLAKADWITFLHQDDELEPGSIDRRLEASNGARFVAGASRTVDEDGRITGLVRADELRGAMGGPDADRPWPALHRFLLGNPIHMGTALLRRDLVDAVGPFDEGLTYSMDYNYWLRCLLRARFAYVPTPVLRHRHSPVQATSRFQIPGRSVDDQAGRREVALALRRAYRTARSVSAPLPTRIKGRWLFEIGVRSASARLPDRAFAFLQRAARPMRPSTQGD